MKKNKFRVLGVMSGTSLDGIDLALIDFWIDPWKFNLVKTVTIPYSDQWIKILNNIYSQGTNKINEVDNKYTVFLGGIIRDFIINNQMLIMDLVFALYSVYDFSFFMLRGSSPKGQDHLIDEDFDLLTGQSGYESKPDKKQDKSDHAA